MDEHTAKRAIKATRIEALAKHIARLAKEYRPETESGFETAYRQAEMARTAEELARLTAGW